MKRKEKLLCRFFCDLGAFDIKNTTVVYDQEGNVCLKFGPMPFRPNEKP